MTDEEILIGSLSNDLYRVANLFGRGSEKAANRFWQESKRWSGKLLSHDSKKYIHNIILDLESDQKTKLSQAKAEKLLMYSVLLQNYVLHARNSRK